MKKGFTLIELLVVVLIIGILSAIALPQYQKAVRKARIAEARINLRAIADATDRYILENGDSADMTMNTLDISVPQETKNWNYSIDECICDNGKCGCWIIAYPQFESDYTIEYVAINYSGGPVEGDENDVNGHFLCYSTNENGNKICDGLGHRIDESNVVLN